MKSEGDWAWHVHHDILLQRLKEPIENRVDYIKSTKPKSEIPIRLRLLRPAKGLGKTEAYAKWEEAYAKWEEAYAKRREADAKRREADAKRREADAKWREAYAKRREADAKRREADAKLQADPAVLALHKVQCPDCPWDGKTIFPKAKST